MNKSEILRQLREVSQRFLETCDPIEEEEFFRQPVEKWSISQNVRHLVISAKMTKLAYRLPKFIVKWYTGKPNRGSRSYNELVARYKAKLEAGGKASGRFVPGPDVKVMGKKESLAAFSGMMKSLEELIGKKWKDEQLDQYLAPHPLLGKITLRELGMFTIYHTGHHLEIIRQRLAEFRAAHPENA